MFNFTKLYSLDLFEKLISIYVQKQVWFYVYLLDKIMLLLFSF